MLTRNPIRLAVIGAGLIGERHARQVASHPDFELAAIVDGNPDRRQLADELGCLFRTSAKDIAPEICQAAIVATPNSDHLTSARICADNGWACLMEKPIADSVTDGEAICEMFETQKLPLLVGHHRRYHPFVGQAQRMLSDGSLGKPVFASVIWAVRKPDDYFKQGAWRLNKDGGPLLINFIHEADLMLGLFGPVANVQAIASNAQRGGPVEDSAAAIMRFESGLLATVVLSDAALSPWSFEGASNENPNIAETGMSSWRIGCTQGSFDFPSLQTWQDAEGGLGDWSRPLKQSLPETERVDPLMEQLTHFAECIRNPSTIPKVSDRDGLNALALVQAVQQSAEQLLPVGFAAS